jgi:hypothetical protein
LRRLCQGRVRGLTRLPLWRKPLDVLGQVLRLGFGLGLQLRSDVTTPREAARAIPKPVALSRVSHKMNEEDDRWVNLH